MKKFINNLFDSKPTEKIPSKECEYFDDDILLDNPADRTADLQEALISASNALKEKEENLLTRQKLLEDKEKELANRLEVLEEKEKHLNEFQKELKERQLTFDKKIQRQLLEVPEPIIQDQKKEATPDYTEILNRLEKITTVIKEADHKDKIIKDLHDELQKKNRDFYSELTRPVIKSIIRIHDFVGGTLKSSSPKDGEDPESALRRLTHAVEGNCLMIEDLLNDEFNIEMFSPEKGDQYLPKEHTAIITIDTDNPELAGTVKECRQTGFKESGTGRILKNAVVAVYKMKK